jgi:hypothetical protein
MLIEAAVLPRIRNLLNEGAQILNTILYCVCVNFRDSNLLWFRVPVPVRLKVTVPRVPVPKTFHRYHWYCVPVPPSWVLVPVKVPCKKNAR